MIKIFKWYIVSDLDLFIEKDMACKTLNRRIRYLEKENENLYFENVRLRNEQIQVTNIIEPKDITLKKYISEDKIRKIIKKYQEKAEDVKQKYKGVYAYRDDYLEALAKIEGYQELLEEN